MAETTTDKNLTDEEDETDLSNNHDLSHGEVFQAGNDDTDSACEDLGDEDQEPEPLIPQTVLDFADTALSRLPPRWRNWITRMVSGFTLISGFSILVSFGPIGLIFLTYMVEYACYSEVLKLGLKVCAIKNTWMKKWCWVLFYVIHWIVIAEDVKNSQINLECVPILAFLIKYNMAVGLISYLTLIVTFVLSMSKKHYLNRYAIFAWCHICLLFLAAPGHLLNKAMLNGLIWYVMPMFVITINDIAAYMVGFFGGRTPLIELSPKKTQEGFMGGGLATLFLGTLFVYFLMVPYMVCPVELNSEFLSQLVHLGKFQPLFSVSKCQPAAVFQPTIVNIGSFSFQSYPFLFHGFLVSLFSSLIGPFGGFLASGLKRACKQKNFGSLIPGHGGVLDRCDCMFLMAAFSYVYVSTLKINETL